MKAHKIFFLISLAIGLGLMSMGGFIHFKGTAAQYLLKQAWASSIENQIAQKPWPWADTRAVALLRSPSTDTHMVVLDGTSGEAMAFGPGLQNITPATQSLNYLIGGHRDTHMGFMKGLKLDDKLHLETIDGSTKNYQIKEIFIANTDTQNLQVNPQENSLILVTCYPFDAVFAGGAERYVVIAKEALEI